MAVKKRAPVKRARAKTPSPGGQSAVISMIDWLKYLIVAVIPIVGLVMCFVWAAPTKLATARALNRRNLFRAILILAAAGVVLGIIFGVATQGFFGLFGGI